jgi:hypothetical protein
MRIWSIHPKYLDSKGLVALWREGLLAKHVLENKTKGYRNHPQLLRFKNTTKPLDSINYYLSIVCDEAKKRNYNFDSTKIDTKVISEKITVTHLQVEYEKNHLLKKLETRDFSKYSEINKFDTLEPHPLFYVIDGEIESWEILNK